MKKTIEIDVPSSMKDLKGRLKEKLDRKKWSTNDAAGMILTASLVIVFVFLSYKGFERLVNGGSPIVGTFRCMENNFCVLDVNKEHYERNWIPHILNGYVTVCCLKGNDRSEQFIITTTREQVVPVDSNDLGQGFTHRNSPDRIQFEDLKNDAEASELDRKSSRPVHNFLMRSS